MELGPVSVALIGEAVRVMLEEVSEGLAMARKCTPLPRTHGPVVEYALDTCGSWGAVIGKRGASILTGEDGGTHSSLPSPGGMNSRSRGGEKGGRRAPAPLPCPLHLCGSLGLYHDAAAVL